MDAQNKSECSITGLEEFPLGYSCQDEETVFRLFAPQATDVQLVIYDDYTDEDGLQIPLEKNDSGIWETIIQDTFHGKWYAYLLDGPSDNPFYVETKYPIADPRSRFVTTKNHHLQFPKTKITDSTQFNWDDDDFVAPEDPRDLIIYETHIKDMVAHPSAKTYVQGIYNDFREAKVGGIQHLKRMGVNAVEFLPLQKFAYFEPPFGETTEEGIKNTWNPYSKNYWGYMTSFHFAPETIYASDASLDKDAVVGRTDKASTELKQLVKALHKENITVIMDVVYNHASHYDLNPLIYTGKEHYFRLDEAGNFLNDSWTGNDIDTQAKYAQEVIVESIKHWITEYHIDGFRFDLAGIIDWNTIDLIKQEAQKINPNVVLIAEPWGGKYAPEGFSEHGWSSWNDRFRNGMKGYNPKEDRGFIFGNMGLNSRFTIENYIRGTLKSAEGGLFQHSGHSVNYLESHDGYTLGDYIRIALDHSKAHQKYFEKAKISSLSPKEEKIAKLGAITLFVSQGITMMHAGQEWARSKIIQDPDDVDPEKGKIDRDTYNKDDGTNWLNFNEISLNKDLFEYYKGLIKLRLKSPALRKANPDEINFKVYNHPLHITFSIDGKSSGDMYDYFVSLNANSDEEHEIVLPKGYWELVVSKDQSGFRTIRSVKDSLNVPASSGVVLRKLRVSKA
ncbi:pullulanase [Gracilimonas sp.]|uniref:pullulanase n=1 Tax=Gracilimonas sp. TaxID=1974203 RepID=UPI002870CBC9|nr:hypothetical protein [Gracilimonas sp.]